MTNGNLSPTSGSLRLSVHTLRVYSIHPVSTHPWFDYRIISFIRFSQVFLSREKTRTCDPQGARSRINKHYTKSNRIQICQTSYRFSSPKPPPFGGGFTACFAVRPVQSIRTSHFPHFVSWALYFPSLRFGEWLTARSAGVPPRL